MAHPVVANLVRYALRTVVGLVLTLVAGVALYLLFAYHFAYSRGESVGFVQKISYKGWVCKTWEGEQVRRASGAREVRHHRARREGGRTNQRVDRAESGARLRAAQRSAQLLW